MGLLCCVVEDNICYINTMVGGPLGPQELVRDWMEAGRVSEADGKASEAAGRA